MEKAKKKQNKEGTKEKIREAIGSNIRRIRRSARTFLSAEKVAMKLGVSRVTLTQIENGKKNINAVLLWELSCILGCDIKSFFPDTPDGFQLSFRDIKEVKKIDPNAVAWAEDLFGKPNNKNNE
jgi:transcriptional regulator with XRE-family HTH domain